MTFPESVPKAKLTSPMDSWDDSTPKTYIIPMHLYRTKEHKLEKKTYIESHIVNSASSHVLFTRTTSTQAYAHSHKSNGAHEGWTSCSCALAHHHTHTYIKHHLSKPLHMLISHTP